MSFQNSYEFDIFLKTTIFVHLLRFCNLILRNKQQINIYLKTIKTFMEERVVVHDTVNILNLLAQVVQRVIFPV